MEDLDFFFEVSLLVFELFSGDDEVVLSSSKLFFNGGLLSVALCKVSSVLSNNTLESLNVSSPLFKFFLVNLDFVFELELEVSSGDACTDFVFKRVSDLSSNGVFDIVEEGQEFTLDGFPRLSGSITEAFQFEVTNIVINVAGSDFIS